MFADSLALIVGIGVVQCLHGFGEKFLYILSGIGGIAQRNVGNSLCSDFTERLFGKKFAGIEHGEVRACLPDMVQDACFLFIRPGNFHRLAQANQTILPRECRIGCQADVSRQCPVEIAVGGSIPANGMEFGSGFKPVPSEQGGKGSIFGFAPPVLEAGCDGRQRLRFSRRRKGSIIKVLLAFARLHHAAA
ncbi:hypothetical protein Barb7_02946 [Bacteroidales bacterium Barb7]|nr:hypothetical protein Barb7_02946 [Bacteroidales bacterium Barb7]